MKQDGLQADYTYLVDQQTRITLQRCDALQDLAIRTLCVGHITRNVSYNHPRLFGGWCGYAYIEILVSY